jgi:hypothetical protein
VKPPYLWRAYVDVNLKRPVQQGAFDREMELRVYLSKILKEKLKTEGLIEVKK